MSYRTMGLFLFLFGIFSEIGLCDTACLVRDPHFFNGLIVYSPEEGNGHRISGKLTGISNSTPIWGLSQWNTKSPFEGNIESNSSDPRYKVYTEGSKSILFGREKTMYSDLTLHLNTNLEYTNGVRDQLERWPALYAWQKFDANVSIDSLENVNFNLDARLNTIKNLHQIGTYDPKKDAAQYTVFLTIQNLNKKSLDYGKYVWFGLQIYDNRQDIPQKHEQGDKFTKKFIYLVDSHLLTKGTLNDLHWVHFQGNILDEIKTALQHAQANGFFNEIHYSDFFIKSINVGWEIPGTFDAEIQIKDLNICYDKN
ncbi:MAG: hypothetical protein PHQ35_10555 [Phycisphaerae bacterium]|nr:hypothetical protein [Phycisphaerae bacterium]